MLTCQQWADTVVGVYEAASLRIASWLTRSEEPTGDDTESNFTELTDVSLQLDTPKKRGRGRPRKEMKGVPKNRK